MQNRTGYIFLLCSAVCVAIFLLHPSDKISSYRLFTGKDSTEVALFRGTDSTFIIKSLSSDGKLICKWPLRYPVYRFETCNIDGDSLPDLIVGVIKRTRFDSIVRKRLFIFSTHEGYIRPLWLGSRVSQPLFDFHSRKAAKTGLVRTIEYERDGSFMVADYSWRGFGLAFNRYIRRNTNLADALNTLNSDQ